MDFKIRPKGFKHPLIVRGRSSDSYAFYSVIASREYCVDVKEDIHTVMDAGANVGYASVFFAECYPDATIIALEPEAKNFKMLIKNTQNYPNIKSVNAALWSQRESLCLDNPNVESWAFQYCSSDAPDSSGKLLLNASTDVVPGLTVIDLMNANSWTSIDILKMDIEGAEKQVFQGHPLWLSLITTLLIEIHEGCWESVFKSFEGHPFDCQIISKGLLKIDFKL